MDNRLPTSWGTAPGSVMSAAICSTLRPGLQVAGHVATVASRDASTTAKLTSGLSTDAAAISHSPSGSRVWVRSRVSRIDSEEVQVVAAGEAVAATLPRHVAAES